MRRGRLWRINLNQSAYNSDLTARLLTCAGRTYDAEHQRNRTSAMLHQQFRQRCRRSSSKLLTDCCRRSPASACSPCIAAADMQLSLRTGVQQQPVWRWATPSLYPFVQKACTGVTEQVCPGLCPRVTAACACRLTHAGNPCWSIGNPWPFRPCAPCHGSA